MFHRTERRIGYVPSAPPGDEYVSDLYFHKVFFVILKLPGQREIPANGICAASTVGIEQAANCIPGQRSV